MIVMIYLLLVMTAQAVMAVTVYLAGDSTMARGGGGSGTEGWGEYLQYSLSISVVNGAMGGRSARSFTRESRFSTIANALKSGDIVVIEFGHNDGGGLATDNGRSDCPGSGSETCRTTYNGVSETVLTFPVYLENAARTFKAKGASVIISSQTPNNPDEGGSFTYTSSRFVALAQTAASVAAVDYVDHGQYTANLYKTKSIATVDSYFPNDHTHTSPNGASAVSDAFIRGVLCGNSPLRNYIRNATASVEGSCIGGSTPRPTTSTLKAATTAATHTPTIPTTTSGASGGTCSVQYGQCGGISWSGTSRCCTGICKVLNSYYSQCT